MGIELARAYITVQADSSSLGPDLDRIKADVESKLNAIQAGAAAVLGLFARFGSGVLKEGLGQAEFLEKTTVEMETMLGSAEETQETLAKLTKFASETPFEMPQLLNLSRELITFGERGDDMMGTLKMLGDVSSGDAQKFGMVGLVFNQVRGAGKLLTQDFRQLSTRGVISLKDIATHFKVTDAEASKMLSTGKIGFEDFRKILQGLTEEGGRFANGMARQAQTMGGLRSTMNDNINLVKRFLAEPLVPYIKAWYQSVISVADALGALVKAGGEAVSFAAVGAVTYAGLRAAMMGAGLAARFLGIQLKTTQIILAGFKAGAIIAIGAALGALVSYLGIPKLLGDGFAWLKNKIFGNKEAIDNFSIAWYRIKEAARIVFEAISSYFAPFLGKAKLTWDEFWKSFDKTITKMILKISEWVLNAAEWLQVFAEHAGDIWKALPDLFRIAFSTMVDIAENAGFLIVDALKAHFGQIIDLIHMLATEWAIFWENEGMWARGLKGLTPAAAAAMRAQGKEESEKAKNQLGLGLSGRKLFDLSPETKALIDKEKELWDKINKRKDELKAMRAPLTEPQGPEREPGKGKGAAPAPAAELLKPGMFQIPEWGRKLQESALKGKDNMEANIAKMVGIGEIGNQLQADANKKLDKLNPGLG